MSVNPIPTLGGATQAAAVCDGFSATINLTGLLSGSTSTVAYSIDGNVQTPVTGVIADGSGNASFTSAVLTAAQNGKTLRITGITVTSLPTNCSASFTQDIILSVHSLPVPTISGLATACEGATSVTYTTETGGGITGYSWTVSGGGLKTSGGGASDNTMTVTWNTAGSQSVTVNYLDGNGCTATSPTSKSITINPLPTLTGASQAAAVCEGNGATINLTGLLASSTSTIDYKINGVAQSAVSGVAANVSGAASFASAALSAANNGQILEITAVTVTSAPTNCSATFAQDVTLSVNPLPNVGLTVSVTTNPICSGSGTNITVTSSEAGINYQLRNNADNSPVNSPVSGGGTINLPTGTLTSTTTFNVLAINATTSCSAQLTGTVTVTVNPTPAILAMSTTVCSAAGFTVSPVDVTNGVVPSGTTYSWAAPAGSGFTGGTSGSAAGSITGTLTNTTTSAQTATYTVTPLSGTCTGADFTVTVTINPAPNVTPTPASQTICNGAATNIVLSTSVTSPTVTYSWTAALTTGTARVLKFGWWHNWTNSNKWYNLTGYCYLHNYTCDWVMQWCPG